MPKIILVRHGETKLNAKSHGDSNERIRGWADIPLDRNGIRQADDVAKYIAANFDIKEIYSSPLIRAVVTAQTIAKDTNVSHIYKTIDLTPWNLGDMTGQKVSDIISIMKNYVIHEEKSVPNGEPFSIFRRRFLSFLKDKINEAKADNCNIVLVAHTRNCQLARAWIAAGEKEDLSIDHKTMDNYDHETLPGGVFILDI